MKHSRLLFWAVLLTAFAASAHANTIIAVGNLPSPINVGDSFDAAIVLESVAIFPATPIAVYGFDMEVTFPSFLTAQTVTEQGFFGATGIAGFASNYVIDNVNDNITGLFDASTSPDINSPVLVDILFSITFQATATGTGDISITCDQGNDCVDFPLLSDNAFNSIPVDSLDSQTVTVTPNTTTPTPEPGAASSLGVGMLLLMLGRKRLRTTAK